MKERGDCNREKESVNACEKRKMLIYIIWCLERSLEKKNNSSLHFDSYALECIGGKHSIETSFWYKELSGEMDHSNSNTYSRVVCVLKMNKMIWPLTMTIVKWKSVSCVQTLFNPMDYTVHGILQARILECVAFPFSMGSFQPRNWTGVKQY